MANTTMPMAITNRMGSILGTPQQKLPRRRTPPGQRFSRTPTHTHVGRTEWRKNSGIMRVFRLNRDSAVECYLSPLGGRTRSRTGVGADDQREDSGDKKMSRRGWDLAGTCSAICPMEAWEFGRPVK